MNRALWDGAIHSYAHHLFVCPGMTLVRFLQLQEGITEWTLALAMSLVIDTLVAGIQLYTGTWSTEATLIIIIVLCIAGVSYQIFQANKQVARRRAI